MKIQKAITLLSIIVTTLSLGGCALPGQENGSQQTNQTVIQEKTPASQEQEESGIIVAGPDSYDSADTAVLVRKNEDDGTVTLLNLDIGREYTLSVDGTTTLYDKYGEAVSLEQLEEGDIVDVTFLKSKKRLNSMQLSAQAWEYEAVNRYEIDTDRNDITIGKDVYKISDDTLYLSGGRQIEIMDLNAADTITVKGIDKSALSIRVDNGHGYLRLVNDENFVGGWIEIGQSQIKQITEDMLLTVPEGSYQVSISHNGGGGIKDVVINRNEETTLDIGDLKVAEAKYGDVLFSLTPSDTTVYVDGTQVDTSGPVNLEYGIHQIIAKAEGYKSITSYLKVGQESAGIDIVLESADTVEEEAEETQESEETEDSTVVTSYYRVYIDAPENAEVYLDGNYVGIVPCSFRKTEGEHTIVLRRTGYETRSYTINVDSEEKDISYSFVDLVRVVSGSSNSSSSTGSSNSSSSTGSSNSSGKK